jgi:hypothetical protein
MTAGEGTAMGDEREADLAEEGTARSQRSSSIAGSSSTALVPRTAPFELAGHPDQPCSGEQRGPADRRSEWDRRTFPDRRGTSLRTPASPSTVRPYAFRSFDDQGRGEDRRLGYDRRWDQAGTVVILTQEELAALLGPTDD